MFNISEKTTRVELLDYFRGTMALSVLLYHYLVWSDISIIPLIDETVNRLGIYAVSGFYILSGISLALVNYNKVVNAKFIKGFFIKRFFRIAPLFYIATTLTLIMVVFTAWINKDYSQLPTFNTIFLNYSFLFSWISPDSYIATGAWSIGNEIFFYTLFPIIILLLNRSARQFIIFLAISILLTLYISNFIIDHQDTLVNQWAQYINPLNQLYLFTIGCFIGTLVSKRIKIRRSYLFMLLIISICIFVFYPIENMDQISLVTGAAKVLLSISMVGICVVAAFWGNTKKNAITKVFQFLGDISYSLYLLHPISYFGWKAVLSLTLGEYNMMILCSLSVASTLIAASFVYYCIERRFISIGRKLSLRV